MEQPRLARLAWLYLRVGNLTFGGGDPAMAALQREMVTRLKWVTEIQCGVAYGLARITPGTNVVAFCAALSWMVLGWRGALAAVLASTVPCSALVVWLTGVYEIYQGNRLAAGAIAGTIAAAVGMMAAGAWILLRPHLLDSRRWPRTLLLAGGAVVLALVFGLPPLAILALAALTGYFWREGRS